jgi:hypothetical protein
MMTKRTLDEIELSVTEYQDELNQMLSDDSSYAEWAEAQHIQAVDEQNQIEPTIQTLAESAAQNAGRAARFLNSAMNKEVVTAASSWAAFRDLYIHMLWDGSEEQFKQIETAFMTRFFESLGEEDTGNQNQYVA